MPTPSPTGRITHEGPNIQTIPVRTPEGALIRKAFIQQLGEPMKMKAGLMKYVANLFGLMVARGQADMQKRAIKGSKNRSLSRRRCHDMHPAGTKIAREAKYKTLGVNNP